MEDILDRNLREMTEAVRRNEITSVKLVQGFLERIEKVNSSLNAVVSINTEIALKLAAKADSDLKEGIVHGPLHGIPMTIKDSLDTKDMVTTWGTKDERHFARGGTRPALHGYGMQARYCSARQIHRNLLCRSRPTTSSTAEPTTPITWR